MLVLSRKKGQAIIIDGRIEVTVLEVEGDTVKIGIAAPREVQITRKELLQSVKETNEEAASAVIDVGQLRQSLQKMKKNLPKL
ncbi:Carbon storage regulator homolog [Thermobacillus xylanilyticus]|uniref:Translational regulator CsrA n=1 Tax=Thermobacillus xylanilyticus TaxID=76633 RepID=A0ABN7RXQ8_THEXY|nr:carbon storage regulator CsrA [Thermobacillus xylanilyticus]CAG5088521.1 Carbon storage regulator homolog [Thermobacillus xylanilyticus]